MRSILASSPPAPASIRASHTLASLSHARRASRTSVRRIVALLLLSHILSISVAHAQSPIIQQGNKLVGTGAGSGADLGSSVAISADGNTLLFGGPEDNAGVGGAWVFTRTAGVWSQQGSKLLGSGATGLASQGTGVALSADGNTAIVGGSSDNGGTGATWVFTRSGGVWSQQGTKLVGTGAAGAAQQGWMTAVSADGNTALVGAFNDNGSAGAAWVFVRSGGVWTQQGGKLVGSGAVGPTYQGYAVSLSSDGATAVLGGYGDNGNRGAAWVFTRSGGVWSQQGSKLVGTGAVGLANQGIGLAVSGDGNTILLGGWHDDSDIGATWVFTRSGGVWTQQGAKLVGTGVVGGAGQGYSAALTPDGNFAIVGGPDDASSAGGATWAFSRTAGVWSQVGSKFVGSGATGLASQGVAVALSADGSTAVIGAPSDNGNTGAAWVFIRPSPKIVTVHDVPNDQGGKVSIRWNASLLDNAPNNPIDEYWIWRQVPIAPAPPLGSGRDARRTRTTVDAGQVYYWEFVASQPSHGFAAYSYTAATTSDSIAGSNPYTLFMVEAERAQSEDYWSSAPDSGYSVDNLPPASLLSLTGKYSAGATHLHWSPSPESDFAVYRIYRGSSAGFVPGPGNLVATLPDTGYADAGPAGGYYKVSAVDVHGNESVFALIGPSGTLDVPGSPLPRELSLAAVTPNPRSGAGVFRFSLPRAEAASLAIFDAAGRLVRVLASGPLSAGEHEARWDGRDAHGKPLPDNIYFLRLEDSSRSLTRKFVQMHLR